MSVSFPLILSCVTENEIFSYLLLLTYALTSKSYLMSFSAQTSLKCQPHTMLKIRPYCRDGNIYEAAENDTTHEYY